MKHLLSLSTVLLLLGSHAQANCLAEYGKALKDRSAVKSIAAGAGLGIATTVMADMATANKLSHEFYAIGSVVGTITGGVIGGVIYSKEMAYENARALVEASRIHLGLDTERKSPVMFKLIEITNDMTAAEVLEAIKQNKLITEQNKLLEKKKLNG